MQLPIRKAKKIIRHALSGLGITKKFSPESGWEPLSEKQSISHQLPYRSYDSNTQIYHNTDSLGCVLQTSPLTSITEEQFTILHSLINDSMPENITLQILLYANNNIMPMLSRHQESRTKTLHCALNSDLNNRITRSRINFMREGTLHSRSAFSPMILRNYDCYWVLNTGADKSGGKHLLQQFREQLLASLQSVGVAAQSVEPDNFISLLLRLLYPANTPVRHNRKWHAKRSLSQQLLMPDYDHSIDEYGIDITSMSGQALNGSENESWRISAFSVDTFPTHTPPWKMGEAIGHLLNTNLQLQSPTVFSLFIKKVSFEKAQAKTQMQYFSRESKSRSLLAKFLPRIKSECNDWQFVREQVASGESLLDVHYQVVSYANTAVADTARRALQDLCQANGWSLSISRYLQLPSWLAVMPMVLANGLFDDLKLLGRTQTMTASNALSVSPLLGEWKGTPSTSMLFVGRRGQLASWDPFDNTHGNYNIAIAARSGSGKSVFTQEYLLSILGRGGRVWVIDAGRSYEKTATLLGGEFIAFEPSTVISLNVFTHIRHFQESLPLLKPLFCTMARPEGDMTREESNYIEKALNLSLIHI